MSLSNEEIKALLLFLERTELKGSEARIFTILIEKLEKIYLSQNNNIQQNNQREGK
jgi:hypothetical protein